MKHDLFRKYKATEVSNNDYSYFKIQFTSLLKRTKINYFREKFERCKNNIRLTWRNITNVLGCERTDGIDEITHNSVKYENHSDISRVLNEYFSSVAGNRGSLFRLLKSLLL